jgi:meiosis induction protein kinase IME2/SME1
MTVCYDHPPRSVASTSMATLEDRFEVIKEVGDGSFGSVAVARVRTAGSNVARRGTMVSYILKSSFHPISGSLPAPRRSPSKQ